MGNMRDNQIASEDFEEIRHQDLAGIQSTQQPSQTSTAHLPTYSSDQPSTDDIVIAVMGITGAGKSTFISLLVDESQDVKIGYGLKSCTNTVGIYYFNYNERTRVFLVDTPGFDDTTRSDADILKDLAFWLTNAYQNKIKLAGIIYLHRIIDPRVGGAASRNLRMFRQLCGEKNMDSVILATTHWTNSNGPTVTHAEGESRVQELVGDDGFWGFMVKKGSTVVRHDGSKKSAIDIITQILRKKKNVILDLQKQLVDEKKTLAETDAGQALEEELIQERKRHQEELEQLMEDQREAMEDHDAEWAKQIEREKEKQELELRKNQEEAEALRVSMEKISKQNAEALEALHRSLAAERERVEAERREREERYENEKRERVAELENLRQDNERKEREWREAMAHRGGGCVIS